MLIYKIGIPVIMLTFLPGVSDLITLKKAAVAPATSVTAERGQCRLSSVDTSVPS